METCSKNRKTGTNQFGPIRHKFKQISILLILTFNLASAQKIDSLITLLGTETKLTRCRILNELAYEYLDVDSSLALEYGRKAFNTGKENSDMLVIVESGRIMSLVYEKIGHVDSSINILNEILPIALEKNYESEIVKILNLLGLSYTFRAEYDKALQCHFRSLQLRERRGDISAISVSLTNIGLVYYKMKDYQKALSFFNKSLILKSQVRGSDMSMVFVNMSLCYTNLNDFSKAKDFVEKALHLCKDSCSKEILIGGFYSLGLISTGTGELKQAESQFLYSYNLSKEIGDQRFMLDNIVFLSKIYIRSNKLQLAEKYLHDSQELIQKGVPYNLELIKVYGELFSLYSKSKNYEKVSIYQSLYIQLKDSIYSDELTRNLVKVEADYLERENRSRIEAQNRIMILDNEVIFRQRIVNVSVVLVSVLLAVLSFVLIRSNKSKKLMNRLLDQKVKERTIELKENQLTLLKTLDERALQFQKLSNDVKGSIATIRGLCSLAITDMESPPSVQYLHRIDKTANQLICKLNDVTF